MAIKFKSKNGKTLYFSAHSWNIEGFCAWDTIMDYGVDDHDWASDDDFCDRCGTWSCDRHDVSKEGAIAESRLLRTLLKEMADRANRHILLGDERGGVADTYLFPYVPKRSTTIGNVKYKFELSPYYRNNNTGNDVRHLLIRTFSSKEKKRAA